MQFAVQLIFYASYFSFLTDTNNHLLHLLTQGTLLHYIYCHSKMPFGSKSNGGSNAKDAGSSFPWKKKKEPEPAKPSFFTAKTSGQNGTEVEASPAFSWGKKQQEETVAPTAPAPARSFPWSKKKQETAAV